MDLLFFPHWLINYWSTCLSVVFAVFSCLPFHYQLLLMNPLPFNVYKLVIWSALANCLTKERKIILSVKKIFGVGTVLKMASYLILLFYSFSRSSLALRFTAMSPTGSHWSSLKTRSSSGTLWITIASPKWTLRSFSFSSEFPITMGVRSKRELCIWLRCTLYQVGLSRLWASGFS